MNRKEEIDTLVDYILSLIPEEVSKNWLKMNSYLALIYWITTCTPASMVYMVNKGIVTRLIDFFLENDSPKAIGGMRRQQMGSNYANPPFDYLISTVAMVARSMPRLFSLSDLNPNEDYFS